jgi:hypothetical protein
MWKNRYEVAFERYLRLIRRPCLSNRQERRFLLPNGSTLKNFDNIVQSVDGSAWIVDVKGRLFPSGVRSRRYWKNWTTQDDVLGLLRWEEILNAGGRQYRDHSAFVFAYRVVGSKLPLPENRLFRCYGERYAFFVVPVKTYLTEARLISPRWNTYEAPTARFREIARPADEFFAGAKMIVSEARPATRHVRLAFS